MRFRPKVAPSGELICWVRVPHVGVRCRGGLRNFRTPPSGGPASIPNTRSVEEYPTGIIIRFRALPFASAAWANGAELIFKGNFFVYRPIRANPSGIFALARPGLKVKKNRGCGPPFGGNLMGKLKLWPQISRPLIIRGRRLGVCSTRGLGPYLINPNPQPGPSNWGEKNYFMKNFFRPKTAGANRAEIFRDYGGPQLHRSNCVRSGRYRHSLVKVCNGIPR